jgi:hypothetical protein
MAAGSGPGSATGVAPPGGILSFPADQNWEPFGSIRIITVFIVHKIPIKTVVSYKWFSLLDLQENSKIIFSH